MTCRNRERADDVADWNWSSRCNQHGLNPCLACMKKQIKKALDDMEAETLERAAKVADAKVIFWNKQPTWTTEHEQRNNAREDESGAIADAIRALKGE